MKPVMCLLKLKIYYSVGCTQRLNIWETKTCVWNKKVKSLSFKGHINNVSVFPMYLVKLDHVHSHFSRTNYPCICHFSSHLLQLLFAGLPPPLLALSSSSKTTLLFSYIVVTNLLYCSARSLLQPLSVKIKTSTSRRLLDLKNAI